MYFLKSKRCSFCHKRSHVTRKPVFTGLDQVAVRLKLTCSATEASWSLESLHLASIGIILSRRWTTKVLIRLKGCAGGFAHLLFAYGIKQVFSWHGSNDISSLIPELHRPFTLHSNIILSTKCFSFLEILFITFSCKSHWFSFYYKAILYLRSGFICSV